MTDDWDAPPEGLIAALMERHGCTRAEALRRLGRPERPSPRAVPFRSLPDGARFRYKTFVCEKRWPRVWSRGRRVPDRDYDYDVHTPRRHRRGNARVVEPIGPRRYAVLYVDPSDVVEPLGEGDRQ